MGEESRLNRQHVDEQRSQQDGGVCSLVVVCLCLCLSGFSTSSCTSCEHTLTSVNVCCRFTEPDLSTGTELAEST